MAERDRRRRLRVPKTAERGEIIQIKCLAEHVMESGRRKDRDTGELVPRFLINRMECRYNGELVFFADWFNGMSANPYAAFKLRAAESGSVEVTWIEDDGTVTTAARDIEVVESSQ
jgi:sulfur-oxidizing protein SoxZ